MRIIRFFSLFLMVLLLTLFFSNSVSAHNGGRDELGGHFRSKDCVYFLHEPTPLAQSATNMDELISLIQQHNSNDCKNSLTANKIDLEGYSFDGNNSSTTVESPTPNSSTKASPTHSSRLELGKSYEAQFERCVDGDTAVFTVNGTSYNVRFLFIDTPEFTKEKEAFGKEASEFTCSFIQQGSVTLETDGNTLFDRYNRLLAWVFVDSVLHQEEITKAGLVEDFYDYGDYKYEALIRSTMDDAKASHNGIYVALKSVEQQEPIKTEEKPEKRTDDNKANDEKLENDPINEENLEQTTSADSKSENHDKGSWSATSIILMGIVVIVIYLIRRKIARK